MTTAPQGRKNALFDVVAGLVELPERGKLVGLAMRSALDKHRHPPIDVAAREGSLMPTDQSRMHAPVDCLSEVQVHGWIPKPGSAWQSAADERTTAKERFARLAIALESDVIPQLVRAHQPGGAVETPRPAPPTARQIQTFTQLILHDDDAAVAHSVDQWRAKGLSTVSICIDLLAPTARELGVMWTDDRCDFAAVTIGLGRLQRLLRQYGPGLGTTVEHPVNGRRILLAQPPDEQHSFGLSMVAEFFRRDGWEVLGGIGGAVHDPSSQVATEWFDVVGFSIGSELNLDWLRERVVKVRAASRNRSMVVIVGGPLFNANPSWMRSVDADGSSQDGSHAPELAESLLAARVAQR